MELIAHCSLPRGKIIPKDRSESHCSLNRGHINQRIGSESHCSLENWCHSFQTIPQQSHCQVSILNSQVGSTVKSWWQFRPMARLVKKDAQNTKVCYSTEYLIKNFGGKCQEREGWEARGGHVPLAIEMGIERGVASPHHTSLGGGWVAKGACEWARWVGRFTVWSTLGVWACIAFS